MTKVKIYSSIIVPILAVYISASTIGGISVAQEIKKDADAKISFEIGSAKVNRKETLTQFLEKYNSPLIENVDTFIQVADKYGLDYRLLPAISCMESTCGRFIAAESYNAWGWGIYGNNMIRFGDFDEGIETVGKGIYEGYMKKGLDTPQKMAPIYTPPRPGHWLSGVTHFIDQMDDLAVESV